jgi:acyl-CoA synthetase (AMP-forming)/AMP-acid ligase II
MDAEGFLYFIGRRDEMIKTSGYRVSPTEIEEAVYSTGLVGEAAAYGIDDTVLGQAIVVVVTPAASGVLNRDVILDECRRRLPAYMVPRHVEVVETPLPRNPNGKIDRRELAERHRARDQAQ